MRVFRVEHIGSVWYPWACSQSLPTGLQTVIKDKGADGNQ